MSQLELVRTKEDILKNIETLESYLNPFGYKDKRLFALDLIRKGICFIAYKHGEDIKFVPSRFVGYVNNDMTKHMDNDEKDGRETTPAISKILNTNPNEDAELEIAYQNYCKKLFITVGKKGSFGAKRKYWKMF